MSSQKTLVDFCYRFSHFHPDRYPESDRPIFKGSLKDVCTTTKASKKNESSPVNSVYAVQEEKNKETPLEQKSRVYNEYMFGGLVMTGLLYVSNYVLDR